MKRQPLHIYSKIAGPLPWKISNQIILMAITFSLVSGGQFYLFYNHILTELAELLTFQLLPHELEIVNDALPSLHHAVYAWVLPLALFNLALAAAAAFWLSNRIAGPAIAIRNHLKLIGDGDLTKELNLREKDELKEVADEINQSTTKLQVMVMGLKQNLVSLEAVNRRIQSENQHAIDSDLNAIRMNLEWFDTVELESDEPEDKSVDSMA